jgi:glycosyltransferase involved in cell wall biosynthesis
MRIVFLSKRQYMRKDVMDDRYGRLFELPRQLARRGHDVLALCLSYRRRSEETVLPEIRLAWHSRNLGRTIAPGLVRYLRSANSLIRDFSPDVLIGASDSPHVVLTARLSRRLGIPYVVDLYDNFESFGLARIPGMRLLYRQALTSAAGITCVSRQLAEHVQRGCRPRGPVVALETVADSGLFAPRDRMECRKVLGLPMQSQLVGIAGALDAEHDIGTVYQAVMDLQKSNAALHLVLAGTPSPRHPLPRGPRIHFLGPLEHRLIPVLFNSLDVALVPMKDSDFGRFAFPQKLYEILACQVPILGAAVGAIGEVLANFPRCLYEPGNAADLGEKLKAQLVDPQLPIVPIPTWADQAMRLENLLLQITAAWQLNQREAYADGTR